MNVHNRFAIHPRDEQICVAWRYSHGHSKKAVQILMLYTMICRPYIGLTTVLGFVYISCTFPITCRSSGASCILSQAAFTVKLDSTVVGKTALPWRALDAELISSCTDDSLPGQGTSCPPPQRGHRFPPVRPKHVSIPGPIF